MMKKVAVVLCAALCLEGCTDAPGDAIEADVDARIKSVADRLAAASSDGASGILRITLGNQVLLESGFGSASCTKDEAVTPAHIFMIGSITKEFTRVLGFVLEEKGFFSLEDTVSKIMPDFRGAIGPVTLRQLMDHTGGLPNIIDQDEIGRAHV